MVTAPGLAPAVTVVEAMPLLSVVGPVFATAAEPEPTEKVTVMPGTGLLLTSTTETVSGCANGWLEKALWLFPLTMVIADTITWLLSVKTAWVTPGISNFTCTWPGVWPKVSWVLALPLESLTSAGLVRVAD